MGGCEYDPGHPLLEPHRRGFSDTPTVPPRMKRSFVKVSSKGTVNKVIREHYLRDDIPCGLLGCEKCSEILLSLPSGPLLIDPIPGAYPALAEGLKTDAPRTRIAIVPDTNVLLHYLDIFESPTVTDVILLQTVLEELKHRNMALYSRVRGLSLVETKRFHVLANEHHRGCHVGEKQMGESDNDRNDRAIRKACAFLAEHFMGDSSGASLRVLLLTDDVGNRQRAEADGIFSVSLSRFVEALGDPALADVLEKGRVDEIDQQEREDTQYTEYLPLSQLTQGIREGRYLQGCLHCSHYNAFEGTITVSGATSDIVSVSGRQRMNRAMNGDTVVVELLPKDQWSGATDPSDVSLSKEVGGIAADEEELAPVPSASRQPQGKVIGVIRRAAKQLCGSIDKRSVKPGVPFQTVVFLAMDKRVPAVRIRTRQAEHLASQRVVVVVDDWPVASRLPMGHLVRQLGPAGDRATETEAILLECDVAHVDFTPSVLACLPAPDWRPTEEDYAMRADLRSLDICSVDPPGCTDIDDALHARHMANGLVEVGVHIADVTHFVQAGTALDREAAARATTVYLVDRRIDMLPGLLGTNLCSLQSGVERLSFSVIWEMTLDAQVKSVRFCKSIIASKASLTYDQAQAKLDDPSANDAISASLKQLNALAQILKGRRIEAGALTLASPEVRFTVDRETQSPVDVELKEGKAANSMVEEFMLLANVHVAEQLFKTFPDQAILRRHPAPLVERFEALNQALVGLGQPELDASSSKTLANSLDQIRVNDDAFLNKLIRIMTTRCMQQAIYFASGTQPYDQFWHYGLACPIYTHFTSPIRRYADVLVHRLLASSIAWPREQALLSKQELDDCAHNLNYRNRMSQTAQRSSIELFTHLYFKGKTISEFAYVVRVMPKGFIVILPGYGIEGSVQAPIQWKYDPTSARYIDQDDRPVIHLFKRVQVQAVVEENEATGRPKIRFTLLDSNPGATASSTSGLP